MQKIVVFGGTGFVGLPIVRHLLSRGHAVRMASRHPDRGPAPAHGPQLERVRADITDQASVAAAVSGAFGVVNAVSLYRERAGHTFHSVHVEAAARLAACAAAAGVARLVQLSGVGADPASPSDYIRCRGQGEQAVRAAFPAAIVVRPAVLFGPGDAFLQPLAGMLQRLPLFPVFGSGRTLLQPAYVEDVAEGIARLFDMTQPQPLYELGGPSRYTYRQLLVTIAGRLGTRCLLVPVPFAVWMILAAFAERLPQAPITRNQVRLMQIDTIASPALPGFAALGIQPRGIDALLARAAA